MPDNNEGCQLKDGNLTCRNLFNCCDCGGEGCGCHYCFSCNACDYCYCMDEGEN